MRIIVAPPPRDLSKPHAWTCHWLGILPALAFTLSIWGQVFEPGYDLRLPAGTTADAPDVLASGKAAADAFGRSVRTADINGDGIADVIVGATGADVGSPARTDAGAVFVWFGKPSPDAALDAAATAGTAPDLTIWGATAGDQLTAGGALTAADVTGDGIADLIIGSPTGDGPLNARSNAGEVCIVVGRTLFPTVLDLAVSGSGGADVMIFGASNDDNLTSGGTLAAADVNGDGVADLILGAPLADGPAETRLSGGEAYIVFGRASFPATLDLRNQDSTGADVTLFGANASDFLTLGGGLTFGDVNGDGVKDVLLGAVGGDGPGETRSSSGEAYIVLGRAAFPATLSLEIQGSGGADVTLWGATASDQVTAGGAVAVADLSGDGIADFILGAAGGDGPAEARNGAGEAYVINGRTGFPASLDLAVAGSGGADLTIYGATPSDNLTSGGTLAVGDLNRDGVTDLVLGSPLADGPFELRSSAGEAYVILGGATASQTLDLAITGTGGADVTIYGASIGDNLSLGRALRVGDVDGNGFDDVILGAPAGDGPLDTRINAGEAYLVRGWPHFPPTIDLSLSGIGGASATVFGATASDQLTAGGALAVGDVNGDGIADMLLGASSGDGPLEARSNAGELFIIHGVGAPEMDVTQALAGDILDTGAANFGTVGIDGIRRRTFVIHNTGAANITGLEVTLDGEDAALFTVVSSPTAPLEPDANTTITIAFAPTSFGEKTAALHLASNDEDESPFDIVLTGTCVPPIPPLVATLPADGVGSFEATLHATVNAVGSERSVVFDYGTTSDYDSSVTATPATVDGDATVSVSAQAIGLRPRTLYHFRVRASGEMGAASGQDMVFETVNRPPVAAADTFPMLPGASVALDVLTNDTDPDGDALQVTSVTKSLPTHAGKVELVGGAVVFTAFETFAGATFDYTVHDGFGGVATGTVVLTLGSCSISPAVVTIPATGGLYAIDISASGAWGVAESVPWLTVSSSGGLGDDTIFVTVDSQNALNSRTRTFTIGGQVHTITQLPARNPGKPTNNSLAGLDVSDGVAGTYHGLVDRQTVINASLGSRLELEATATGAFTGKLITGTTAQPLTGVLVLDGESQRWRGVASLAGGDLQPLTLQVALDSSDDSLRGILTDDTDISANVTGWRNPWNVSTKPSLFAASYEFSLYPSGFPSDGAVGSGSFTVDGNSGALLVIGALSDTSVFTSAGFIGAQGQVLLYQGLEGSSGSLCGTLLVHPGTAVPLNRVSGAASWLGSAVGFVDLTAAGSVQKGSPPNAPAKPSR